MASVLPSVVDESLFQCRLCCRSAAEPRLLPCLHVFCRTCLARHVAKLRAAAAQHRHAAVAQNEPDDRPSSPEAGDGGPAASRRGGAVVVEDACLPASARSSIALPSAKNSCRNSRFVVGDDDDDDYEIPRDYEDVDGDQTYANDVMVSAGGGHVMVETERGYAVMASKPLTSSSASSSPQVLQIRAD